ncbi:zinc-binding dehydrogenase [Caballeronia sp. AZ7_KS35]|uniref:zinc-dependent alcohol dehydrogenase n=1 Tax=Caballeronia sp. AZ7_KS35 TaxID=2921762 RepID=UPI0020283B02|nr:zinc-binding dehydrogenase [Caballeronia sp. AZ7_KS35]
MKLVRIHGVDRVSVDDVPAPELGPRDVIVRIGACGICGTDLHAARHGLTLPNGEPMPLGHEAAGVIEHVGDAVEGFKSGMRVLLDPTGHRSNIVGYLGTEGAFGELLLIRNPKPGRHLLAIPDTLSLSRAALAEPLAVGLHSTRRCTIDADTKAAVFGCGPIGLGVILWLRRLGIRHIVAVDLSDARLDYARRMGADATINTRTEDLEARLRELQGDGVAVRAGTQTIVGTDVFFDCAGAPPVLAAIIRMAQYHAQIVVTAVYPEPMEFNLMSFHSKELTITTASGYPGDLQEVLDVLPTLDDEVFATYVSHTVAFKDFALGFELARRPDSAKVMVDFESASP